MKLKFLVFGLIAMLIAACSPSAPAATPAPLTPITIQMSWTFDYSAAYLFAAEINGHFKQEGLQVTLKPGGFGPDGRISPSVEVLKGGADFGMSSAATILRRRAEGDPIVAIGSILQRSPFALISLAENNIQHPQDLIGKTVSVSNDGGMQVYLAMLASQNINPTDVNLVERTSFGIDPLLNGEVDVLGGWIVNEGVLVKEAGKEPNFILMSDYGVDTYDSVLFTTETMIATHPEVVQHMMNAVAAGIKDVVENPQKGVEYTLQYNAELKAEEQQRRIEAAIPLMNVPGIPFASMQPEVWQVTYDIMRNQDVLKTEMDLSEAYTLDFVVSPEGE
jgi:NitT/TauT family transport system substrate-binding protein